MLIRLATIKDTLSILSIYSQYIDTPITFEYNIPTEKEFKERIESIIQTYPYLVCEDNNKIIGYCYAHKFMEREAYKWNAELSIYLDKENTSKGIGKRLYSALINILKYQGIKNLYSKVTFPNIQSEKLHNHFGFKNVGILHNVGYKCGKWHDIIIFEKNISSYCDDPTDIIPIKEISNETILNIIENAKQ